MSVISSEMHNIIASKDIYDGVVKYASGHWEIDYWKIIGIYRRFLR